MARFSRATLACVAAAAVCGGVSAGAASAASDGFKTPSGNIVCLYQGPGGYEPVILTCQTLNDGYTVSLRPSGAAKVRTRQARWGGAGLSTLRYGRSWHRGIYACRVTRSHLTCLSRRSGHGFNLSRDAFGRFRA